MSRMKPLYDNIRLNCTIVSDTHIDEKHPQPWLPKWRLKSALRNAQKSEAPVDAFLTVGDTTSRGSDNNWKMTKECFDKVPNAAKKIILPLGNHDSWNDDGYDAAIKNYKKYYELICKDKRELVCITGDGSIQMNLQELQTILTNKLPIKIFVINNSGYHSIRQTQDKFFEPPYVGIGPDSNDLEFPSMQKLAWAYGYDYTSCSSNDEIKALLDKAFENEGAFIAEVFVGTNQLFEPKSSAKRLPNGEIVSPPLEELSPFLPEEEMDEIMIIPRVKYN